MIPQHDNGDDDLSALDLSAFDEEEESDLDALIGHGRSDEAFDSEVGSPDPVFSATNSAQTVTVTAYLNGAIQRVNLAPHATSLTERELADEIVAVADVAREKARAALYELVSALLRMQGQDSSSMRELLEDRMQLPTPERATSAEAALLQH